MTSADTVPARGLSPSLFLEMSREIGFSFLGLLAKESRSFILSFCLFFFIFPFLKKSMLVDDSRLKILSSTQTRTHGRVFLKP